MTDKNFKKIGDSYVATYDFTQDGTNSNLVLTLPLDAKSNPCGLEIKMDISGAMNGSITASENNYETSKMNMSIKVPETSGVSMDISFDMNLNYSPSADVPTGVPAEGSTIISLTDMFMGLVSSEF